MVSFVAEFRYYVAINKGKDKPGVNRIICEVVLSIDKNSTCELYIVH